MFNFIKIGFIGVVCVTHIFTYTMDNNKNIFTNTPEQRRHNARVVEGKLLQFFTSEENRGLLPGRVNGLINIVGKAEMTGQEMQDALNTLEQEKTRLRAYKIQMEEDRKVLQQRLQ